jgi:hypothetical protein
VIHRGWFVGAALACLGASAAAGTACSRSDAVSSSADAAPEAARERNPYAGTLAYAAADGPAFPQPASMHVLVQRLDANGVTCAPRALTSGQVIDRAPTWSPDATKIAFVRYHSEDDSCATMIMNADGSELRALAPPCGSPAFDDAGNVLVASSGQIFSIPLSGGPATVKWNVVGCDVVLATSADGATAAVLLRGDSCEKWPGDGAVASAGLHVTRTDSASLGFATTISTTDGTTLDDVSFVQFDESGDALRVGTGNGAVFAVSPDGKARQIIPADAPGDGRVVGFAGDDVALLWETDAEGGQGRLVTYPLAPGSPHASLASFTRALDAVAWTRKDTGPECPGLSDAAPAPFTFYGCVPDAAAMTCGRGCPFPEFPRACTSANECAIAVIPPACCLVRETGIRKDSLDAYDAAVRTYIDEIGGCGCTADCLTQTQPDDDTPNGVEPIVVSCANGQCRTTWSAPDAGAD